MNQNQDDSGADRVRADVATQAHGAPEPEGGLEKPSVFDIFIRDPLRAAVEAHSGGRMTVLYDDNGTPNQMHVLPRFSYRDLGFADSLGHGNATAFEVGGKVKSEIFIGAYQASRVGRVGCSLPGAKPWVNITYDDAMAAVAAKGHGWHLMTAHEWAAIAFWCAANGFQPRGNTDEGSAGAGYRHETGIGYGNRDNICRTGSGPAAWRHTGDHTGIADLVGNVLEWNGLMKLVDGEVVATSDNDYTAAESAWIYCGRYLDCSRNRIGLAEKAPAGGHTAYGVPLHKIRTGLGYRRTRLLRRLLIEPAGIAVHGNLYIKDYGERMLSRGGEPESGGGLATAFLSDKRHCPQPDVGFRIAYIA